MEKNIQYSNEVNLFHHEWLRADALIEIKRSWTLLATGKDNRIED
jgi:hypothetical protein